MRGSVETTDKIEVTEAVALLNTVDTLAFLVAVKRNVDLALSLSLMGEEHAHGSKRGKKFHLVRVSIFQLILEKSFNSMIKIIN